MSDLAVVQQSSQLKSWFLALRPKTMTAALIPVVVATALVKAQGWPILWWVSICAALSAIFIQIGTNFINDAIDFKKGADTATRTGPLRVTQNGLLSYRQVMIGGGICFAIAALLGVPLVVQGGWPIVVIGLISLLLGYAYTGGPFPLAYLGLGDVFVILFFGIIAVMGTFYLHTHLVTMASFVAGLQVGFLATVLIAVNNLRDAPQDALVHKKTLAVRFGITFARIEILILTIAPFAMGLYWAKTTSMAAAIYPFFTMPLVRRLLTGVFVTEPSPTYNRFLALAAAIHILFGGLLAFALCSRW